MQDTGDDQETEGADGDARGNLTRGVEHLMSAMRELLGTMTYRGDIDGNEDGRSDDDEEWID